MTRSANLFGWLSCTVAMALSIHTAAADDPWGGKTPYTAEPRATDGRNMALTMNKIEQGEALGRPLVIWALGSSYTNFLGDGQELIAMIRERYPDAPRIVYRKHVGSATEYRFLDGWVRHLLIAEPPDVVIVYAVQKGDGTPEEVIREIMANTTADVVVPSIHYRKQRDYLWGKRDDPVDQNVKGIRALAAKYPIEYVENRGEMAEWMKANGLTPKDMTFDAVHQNGRTRRIINMNIARHFHVPAEYAYDPTTRERTLDVPGGEGVTVGNGFTASADGKGVTATQKAATVEVAFTGNRIELVGVGGPEGGTAAVLIDGKPAEQSGAVYATFIEPQRAEGEKKPPSGDVAPHGVLLGKNATPQQWTFTMVGKSGSGDFELTGSVTGPDGKGNAKEAFVSTSGQIELDPLDWRDSQLTKTGQRFVFDVVAAASNVVSFKADAAGDVRIRLATALANAPHTVTLVANGDGPVTVCRFEVYKPPLKTARE